MSNISQDWDIALLTEAIERLVTVAQGQKNPLSFILTNQVKFIFPATQRVLKNQDLRSKSEHIRMLPYTEIDRQHFEALAMGQEPKDLLIHAVFESSNNNGSVDIMKFTGRLLLALDAIKDRNQLDNQ